LKDKKYEKKRLDYIRSKIKSDIYKVPLDERMKLMHEIANSLIDNQSEYWAGISPCRGAQILHNIIEVNEEVRKANERKN
jgi:hypothetical protein